VVSSAFWYSLSASPNSLISANCSPRRMATATRIAAEYRSRRLFGSTKIVNPHEVAPERFPRGI